MNSFLDIPHLEDEVFQTLREIGNTFLVINMFEKSMVRT